MGRDLQFSGAHVQSGKRKVNPPGAGLHPTITKAEFLGASLHPASGDVHPLGDAPKT